MSEWRVYPPDDYDDTWGYSIKEWDENARTLRLVADSLTEAEAQRIVREHDVIPEMVSLLKEYRENRQEMFSMSSGWPELQYGKYQKQIDRIDAVLALAEGRTK